MNKTRLFTRGGQLSFHNFRMWLQINKTVAKISLLLTLFSAFLLTYLITPQDVLVAGFDWMYSTMSEVTQYLGFPPHRFIVPYHGKLFLESPDSFLSQWQFIDEAKRIVHYFYAALLISFMLGGVIYGVIVKWLTKRGEAQTTNQFIRGIRLLAPEPLAKQIKKTKKASDITMDGFPLILHSEVKHLLFHGTTGVGKGQALMKLMDAIRRRGDRAIVYDKGCTFIPPYYRPKQDVILNPFDDRCANWDLWLDAIEGPDFENMAESLIPLHGETDPFWVNAARTIFASSAYTMQDDPGRSMDKLLKLILTAELEELESYLQGTEAATLASGKIEKTAVSIRSVLTTYLKSLKYLQGLNQTGKPKFSIRNWVQDENKDSWLFISTDAEQVAALRPLISMWLAMASITLLSLPENYDRRIWFIVDELPSLHRLPLLPETIAEVRKFGGCFVLGMQSFAQLEKVYGRNASRELFDLLNTRFFFRSPSAEMAKIVSHDIGEQEVEDTRENYSYGANTIRDGISIGKQRLIRPIVTFSEIMTLDDLHCYLRLPGNYPVTELKLTLEKREALVPGLVKRSMTTDSLIERAIRTTEGKAQTLVAQKNLHAPLSHGSHTSSQTITLMRNKVNEIRDYEKQIIERPKVSSIKRINSLSQEEPI